MNLNIYQTFQKITLFKLSSIRFGNQNFEFKISFFWVHNSKYLKAPRQTFSCMLSSHQDRIVELCAHKIDISDSKLFYYIKLRKIGNLGLDHQFTKHQIMPKINQKCKINKLLSIFKTKIWVSVYFYQNWPFS